MIQKSTSVDTVTHTLPIALLHAAATIAHKGVTHYAMNTVHIKRAGDATLLTATDGKMLIRFPARDVDVQMGLSQPDRETLIPAESIIEAAKRISKRKPNKPEHARITIDGDNVTIVGVLDGEAVTDPVLCKVGDGHYPPCDGAEAKAEGTLIGLNAELLVDLARALAMAAGASKRDAGPVKLWIPSPHKPGECVTSGVRVEMYGCPLEGRATLMPLNVK